MLTSVSLSQNHVAVPLSIAQDALVDQAPRVLLAGVFEAEFRKSGFECAGPNRLKELHKAQSSKAHENIDVGLTCFDR